MARRQAIQRWLRRPGEALTILVLGIPAVWLIYDAFWGAFIADPYPPATRVTGIWAMRFMVLGLAITPVARMSGLPGLIRYRRIVGLWAAAYAFAHFGIWGLDFDFDLHLVTHEILRLRYLFVGFVATVLLVPLAATSFNAAIRWLGGRLWRRLHWLVHPSVLLALWHMATAERLSGIDFTIMCTVTGLAWAWRLARQIPKSAAVG